ncbi:MAG: hypothetical protein XE13_1050 [Proteiniphilum sp. 51_7]|nr:MAG: hypothetical protein XE13_1050 [Proteiniphilum sp. 51_7]
MVKCLIQICRLCFRCAAKQGHQQIGRSQSLVPVVVSAHELTDIKEEIGCDGEQKQCLAKVVPLALVGANHDPHQAKTQVDGDGRDGDGDKQFQHSRGEDGHPHHLGGSLVQFLAFARQEPVLW